MRSIAKMQIPEVLQNNAETWLAEWLADKDSSTKKYRYRHPDIKSRLKEESGYKCVYCESSIGHNTPGDIEHKVPSSKEETLHFEWSNLTIACTECNRRKNDYYEDGNEFIDPHNDPVEDMIEHLGPLVQWKTGNARAEITIRILQLNNSARLELITRKIQSIGDYCSLVDRHSLESNPVLKELLRRDLLRRIEGGMEYSGMLAAVANNKGLI